MSGLDADLFQVVQEVPHVVGRNELQRDVTLW